MAQDQRQIVRQECRKKRKALTQEQQHQASQQVLAHCIEQQLLANQTKVALYLASDGEVDPVQIIHYCWQNQIETYLPVLHPFSEGNLLFLRYQHNSLMRANRYGISEPRLQVQDVCPASALDVIFTPLVAFDQHGNRMGMGGGFYDRTLAPLQQGQSTTKVVGLAHECQQVDALPVESWDIPLAQIVTPKKVFCI